MKKLVFSAILSLALFSFSISSSDGCAITSSCRGGGTISCTGNHCSSPTPGTVECEHEHGITVASCAQM